MPLSRTDRFLQFLNRYERAVSVATMIGGFSFDLVIAKRPDSVFVNVLLIVYLVVSAGVIAYLTRPARRSSLRAELDIAPILAMKFAFGGLASNLLILYSKSGTPAGSILFLVLLLSMLIGNEFLKTRYAELRFNMSVWYLLLLTYCIIAVPTWLLHTIGFASFLISGAVSVAAALVFLGALDLATRIFRGREGRRHLGHALGMIVGMLAFFTALYVTRTIPPVPLALRDIGIYHSVTRDASGYAGIYEAAPWWAFWQASSDTYTMTAGGGNNAYCFSSVFAPTGLTTPIHHRWEYFDPSSNQWITAAIVEYPITGGLEEGYHGYSIKSIPIMGEWRCDVETAQNELIGRVSFTAVEGTSSPALLERSL